MTAPARYYWEEADWLEIAEYIAALDAGTTTEGRPLDHLMLEDVRKFIFLFHSDGLFHKEKEHWNIWTEQNYDPVTGDIIYRVGQWIVAHQDVSGEWFLWYNKIDLTDALINQNVPPPAEIHPLEDPEDPESERIWVFENERWRMFANPTRYHDWDSKSPAYCVEEASIGSDLTSNLEICLSENPANEWLPRQVDPKEQNPYIKYLDTGEFWPQYKGKVEVERKYITQPDTLGAVFGALFGATGLMYRFDEIPGHSAGIIDHWVRFDHYGLKSRYGVNGDQYKSSGMLKQNTRGVSGNDYYPDRLPQTKPLTSGVYSEWFWNPKNNFAYQNFIELICGGRQKADADYIANFKDRWDISGDHRKNEEWCDWPGDAEDLWGENASGFELALKIRGCYDWYFDDKFPYVPWEICRQIAYDISQEESTLEEELDAYDIANLKGTYRRTWKWSLGRVSPFMRSQEMGVPTKRRQEWNPTRVDWPHWYGARTFEMPVISDFDDLFAPIVGHISKHEFTVEGDITDNLKKGWMIHLCEAENQPIKDGENTYLLYDYVRFIRYVPETDRTHIMVSVDLTNFFAAFPTDEFGFMGWNKEVSTRHDADNIVDSEPEFTRNLFRIIYECREMLRLTKFREVSLTSQSKAQRLFGPANWDFYASAEACLSAGMSEIRAEYEPDPNDWSGSSPLGYLFARSGAIDEEGEPNTWYGATNIGRPWSQQWGEYAFYITGDDAEIAELHGNITMLASYTACAPITSPPDIWEGFPDGHSWRPCTIGFGSASFMQPIDADVWGKYYALVGCPITKKGDKIWVRVRITNGLPGILAEYTMDEYYSGGFDNCTWKGGIYQSYVSGHRNIYCVEYNWEKVPKEIFERRRIGYAEQDTQPVQDLRPPRPDPIVHHKKPQAYFVYAAEQGETPEHYELRVGGEAALAEDYEGNEPVKYRGVSEDGEIISDYLTTRAWSVLIKDIDMDTALFTWGHPLDAVNTSNPYGNVTRIYFTGKATGLIAGTEVEILNGNNTPFAGNNQFTVTGNSDNWFDINTDEFIDCSTAGLTVRVYGKGYSVIDYYLEPIVGTKFWLQAKDSKIPGNETTRKNLEELLPPNPDEYPADIEEERQNQPPD